MHLASRWTRLLVSGRGVLGFGRAAVLVLVLPGMRFLHDGPFEGLRRFARVELARVAMGPE